MQRLLWWLNEEQWNRAENNYSAKACDLHCIVTGFFLAVLGQQPVADKIISHWKKCASCSKNI